METPTTTLPCPAALVRREAADETPVTRELLREHTLDMRVNGRPWARLVCTRGDLENLALGNLVAAGLIGDGDDVDALTLSGDGAICDVALKKERRLARPAPTAPARWRREWVFGLADAFAEDGRLHKSTAATHIAWLALRGDVLYKAEDISRHAAVDKAVGEAARRRLERRQCLLFITGRVPVDMARKAVAAGLGVLVSKAVPTAEAVQVAREGRLVLIGRAWPDSFEVY